jgi:hypothetical protein
MTFTEYRMNILSFQTDLQMNTAQPERVIPASEKKLVFKTNAAYSIHLSAI